MASKTELFKALQLVFPFLDGCRAMSRLAQQQLRSSQGLGKQNKQHQPSQCRNEAKTSSQISLAKRAESVCWAAVLRLECHSKRQRETDLTDRAAG